MIQHRINHRILALKNREGHLIHSWEEMEEELTQYFSSLLKEPRNDQDEDIKKTTKHIPKILTEDHNKMISSRSGGCSDEHAQWESTWTGWVYH